MTKKDRERFARWANVLIESLGGTPVDCPYYRWRLETKVGPVKLHVSNPNYLGRLPLLGGVYIQFISPTRARKVVDCNQHSGKWNRNYPDTVQVDDALNDLRCKLQKVLN